MAALMGLALLGCAGVSGGDSGITTYGTVDVGISHTSK
ncbi:hypothetical protein LMG23992_04344 [Cupriavidus laharis]|uniref:Uncharacterized protein n=1 Tax=Cupriavidus laharis TaxID=151654 RepID=A0ABN7ZA16_9BURK|nr:hypothetical protein LMG23992_04344 [Cupriavidus laharis]